MLSVSGKGRRRERGRGGKGGRGGGRWREVEEGVGRRSRRDVEGGEEQRHIVSSSLGEVVCMRSIAHYSVL